MSPLTNLLGWVPVLGRLGRAAIWGVNLLIALVLSLVIIVVSFVAHRWYLLRAVLLLLGVLVAVLVARKRQRGAASGATGS